MDTSVPGRQARVVANGQAAPALAVRDLASWRILEGQVVRKTQTSGCTGDGVGVGSPAEWEHEEALERVVTTKHARISRGHLPGGAPRRNFSAERLQRAGDVSAMKAKIVLEKDFAESCAELSELSCR